MRVLVAGANGQIGRHLVRLLAENAHEVRAMIRSKDQAQIMRDLGVDSRVADLEEDILYTVAGCDAVVFTAGGGPGSGDAKKETVDLGGAAKLIETATEHGARRYVMVSAMGAADPEAGSEGMRPYHARESKGGRSASRKRARLRHHPPGEPHQRTRHRARRGRRFARSTRQDTTRGRRPRHRRHPRNRERRRQNLRAALRRRPDRESLEGAVRRQKGPGRSKPGPSFSRLSRRAYASPSASYSRRKPSKRRRWPCSSCRISMTMSCVTGSMPSVNSTMRV